MPTAFWDAVRVNGKIYGVPNQNYFAYVFGLFLVKKYADKYKDTIPDTITSYADIEPYLATVKKNEPNVTPVYMTDTGVAGGLLFSAIDHGIDAFAGTTGLAGIYYTDKNLKGLQRF